jgi:hypothetical protein
MSALHRCFDPFHPDRMFWRINITRILCSGGIA